MQRERHQRLFFSTRKIVVYNIRNNYATISLHTPNPKWPTEWENKCFVFVGFANKSGFNKQQYCTVYDFYTHSHECHIRLFYAISNFYNDDGKKFCRLDFIFHRKKNSFVFFSLIFFILLSHSYIWHFPAFTTKKRKSTQNSKSNNRKVELSTGRQRIRFAIFTHHTIQFVLILYTLTHSET